jgi:integral membrane sensor domain MASE1
LTTRHFLCFVLAMPSPRRPDRIPRLRDWSAEGRRRWGGLLATAAACFVAAQAGTLFSTGDDLFSPFWPLSGVAAGCLVLGGPWMAVGVYAGVAAHNAFSAMPAPVAWIGPLGLALEAAAVYGLLRRTLGPRPRLTDLRGCLAFLFLVPWPPVLAGGLVGCALLFADQPGVLENLRREFGVFVLAHGGSIALLTPAFAVWTKPPGAAWWRRAAVLWPVNLAAAGLVFFTGSGLPYHLILVPLLAAAVVLGLRGTAPALAAVTLLGMFSVLHDRGPFAGPGGYGQLYLFLAIAALCTSGVAAVVGQFRRRLEQTTRGADSAGLAFWSWERGEGTRFDRCGDRCLLAAEETVRPTPEALFDAATDRGTRETKVDGRDALSFWCVARRAPDGTPEEVNGILLDLSERVSLEQARRRAWQSEVELRNLRTSLAPHLLFNCLAGVRGIVRTDPERARAFIDHLARFLRDSTNAQSRRTIPLLDEWQLCEDFLALQAMRFERELPHLVEIEDDAGQARIPPMILLNLVENAVKHGVVDQHHPLAVAARRAGGSLVVTVRNHGTLGPQPTSRPGGLGMARARLHAVAGDAANLDITQQGGDVVAVLHLPARAPEPAAA